MPTLTQLTDFAEVWARSELITVSDRDKYLRQLREKNELPPDAVGLSELAIRDGLLTKFQVRLLLQGRYKNFFLGGKYKVLEHLGTGGMGAVYLCEHRHMRRRVAVKLLPPDATDPDRVIRFQREAQAIAMMNHPNIVRAFDVDHEGVIHFLVMEFIDGVSLQQLVDRRGPLPYQRVVNYVSQVACGLQHSAMMGLVHRDVKPSNLMLDLGGTVKILDLGLARFARGLDSPSKGDSQIVLGTADYLSPEQVRSSFVDVRADLYSLGAVAYFMLTGKPPFYGGNVSQKLIRHQTEIPKPLNLINSEIPADLAVVFSKMLAKTVEGRQSSPAQLIEELQPWLVDVDLPTPEEMPSERYSTHRDISKEHQSTAALLSKSSRDLILRTMVMTQNQ